MPVFMNDELIGYSAVKAHLIDVGGKEPYATDTTDVFQEGTIFPGVKLYSGGEPVRDILRTLVANSRVPRAIAGDVSAQVVSLRTGADGLRRIVETWGTDVFSRCVERMLDHGETLVRQYFSRIPDGVYTASGEMDNDGISDAPIPFEVSVEVDGSDVRIDFSRAPDARLGPVNCPLADTVGSTRVAMMMLAGGGDQPNEGHFRPIEIITRPGSMFHPVSPSPCFLVGWATLQAMEVIYRALAAAMPDSVPAGSGGDILVLVPWGTRSDNGEPWADCTVNPIGQGAHAGGDGGHSLMHISEAATRLASIEMSEARNPWLFERLELAPDSGGAGHHRGGLGVDTAIRFLDDAWLTTVVERTRNAPWGLEGGQPGRPNSAVLRLPDGTDRTLTKATRVAVPRGSVLELASGGGGGFGDPATRDPAAIKDDVAAGYVTAAAARRSYPQVAAVTDGGGLADQ
jgi:N-methylhydantoinase B